MSESNKPFVVTDRRKFKLDGELREEAVPSASDNGTERNDIPNLASVPPLIEAQESPAKELSAQAPSVEEPPLPSDEQFEQSRLAYEQVAARLETAVRSANPGADHPPPMDFSQLVQSVYLTAIMQMGGGTPEGEQARVDLLGAKQSIDMLSVLVATTKGNLAEDEAKLLKIALFELRMTFLEITQVLSRSAVSKEMPPQQPGIIL